MPRPDGYVSPGSKKELGPEQQQDEALWGPAHGGMYRGAGKWATVLSRSQHLAQSCKAPHLG